MHLPGGPLAGDPRVNLLALALSALAVALALWSLWLALETRRLRRRLREKWDELERLSEHAEAVHTSWHQPPSERALLAAYNDAELVALVERAAAALADYQRLHGQPSATMRQALFKLRGAMPEP